MLEIKIGDHYHKLTDIQAGLQDRIHILQAENRAQKAQIAELKAELERKERVANLGARLREKLTDTTVVQLKRLLDLEGQYKLVAEENTELLIENVEQSMEIGKLRDQLKAKTKKDKKR